VDNVHKTHLRGDVMTRAQQPKTVLVVEHDPWLRAALSNTLADEGYNVVAASNGQSGLRLAELHQPSLVLLDAAVPEVSSRDVLAELRASHSMHRIPVIIISDEQATGGPIVVDTAGLVRKPVDRADLMAQVAWNVGHESAAADSWAAAPGPAIPSLDEVRSPVF
jgi:DNA-binding response OmpR family regulator